MALSVSHLTRKAKREAICVLCQAFERDPVFCYFFPGATERWQAFALIFSDLITANLRFRSVYVATDHGKLVGAAIWRTPDAKDSVIDGIRTAIAQRRLRLISEDAARGLAIGFGTLGALHPEGPHWYLAFVGVAPDRQRGGVGGTLLSPVLAAADSAQVPCYLETPFPETHAFYRRLGFELLDQRSPFPGAGPIWRMQRPPRDRDSDYRLLSGVR